jgi:hypothetical protein
LSASAPSSHDLSLAAFTINIAESNLRHTQEAVLEIIRALPIKVGAPRFP